MLNWTWPGKFRALSLRSREFRSFTGIMHILLEVLTHSFGLKVYMLGVGERHAI